MPGPSPACQWCRSHRVTWHPASDGRGASVSVSEGSTPIRYVDEEPEICQIYQGEQAALGIDYRMPEYQVPGAAATA